MRWKLGMVITKTSIQATAKYLSVKEIQIDWQKNLGSGGYSLVYSAQCRGVKYAAKVIDKQMVRDKNISRVISREIEVHSKLDHPHIIKLQYVAESESCLVILTELATNGNLSGKTIELNTKNMSPPEDFSKRRRLLFTFFKLHWLSNTYIGGRLFTET
jgi:serine/threonine protein kinase